MTPAQTRWEWFGAALRDDLAGKDVQSLGHIFRAVDDLFNHGKYTEVDKWLSSLNATQLSPNLIVGILSITRPASDRLSSRQKFFDDAWKAVEGKGRNAAKLLGALNGRRLSDEPTVQAGELK